MADVVSYSKTKKNKTYILKPDMGCQGRGISITKSVRDIPPHEKLICQVYITKPFLIDGYKFDIRVYTLITSCDPLRIFVYNDGLVRFATSRYREPTGDNVNNIYMHLTNYTVNKHSRLFVVDDELGSKRKISTLNRWLQARSFDTQALWEATDDVIVKTIIAAHPILKHSYHTCFPTHDYTYACFELLGFDILLDEDLKPFVLEVNHSPSFHTDSQIDRDVKEKLLHDTFQILNLNQCDKRKIIEEDRRRVRERLLKGIYKDHNGVDCSGQTQSPLASQVQWEEENCGNFRKVYPCDNFEKYEKFFQQNSSSLFQDTAASRAREEASRMQREESLVRAKEEAARRAGSRIILERLRPESPSSRWKNGKKHSLHRLRQQQLSRSLKNSFDPSPIVEVEEMERLYQLKQREFLVRSYGLIETIYSYLKKNRSLRPEDEIKYGGNVKTLMPLPCEDGLANAKQSSLFPESVAGTRNSFLSKVPYESFSEERKKSIQSCSSILGSGDAKALCVQSNEAPISMRLVPTSKWPYHQSPWQQPAALPLLSNSDIRSTKAQVARSYTNSVKLRQLERRERRGDRES